MGGEGSQLYILVTVELDTSLDGIKAKQLFYICDNLKQSAIFGMDFLRDNEYFPNFSRATLHAGNTQWKLRDESRWEVHRDESDKRTLNCNAFLVEAAPS